MSKWREKNPLITKDGIERLKSIRQHESGPRWNYEVGDQVTAADLAAAQSFRRRIQDQTTGAGGGLPGWMKEWLQAMRRRSHLFEQRLSAGPDRLTRWPEIEPMTREDLAFRLEDIVPFDADLERLIVYDTSGTTGHAIHVPTHPQTLACAHILAERALDAYGIEPDFGPHRTACINVCAQQATYVFATVFSVWDQAGFAKVNLREAEWTGGREGARQFFADLDPFMITADPVALGEMLLWDLPISPVAIFSTAVALSPGLQARVSEHYGCPVIDWYSTTETGPIAFSAPDGRGMEMVAPDIYLEVVDDEGRPVEEGQWGEIALTGGRNPYLPLLRYLTGDRGRVEAGRLLEFEGRRAVYFRDDQGSVVNPVDIARILRLHCSFVQHEFVQFGDDSCRLRLRPTPGVPVDQALVTRLLQGIFGRGISIEIIVDQRLGDGKKVVPYRRVEDGPES